MSRLASDGPWDRRTPPVILIGMHRSGTTMVTRMLEALGLFAGCAQDMNSEAVFFVALNDWMLRSAGGRWDFPEPFRYLLDQPQVFQLVREYLELSVTSPRAAQFLGRERYRRYRDIRKLDTAWGWKDPRNTITLPLWLSVFPEARVIHVHRHGVDVARSLQKSWAPTQVHIDAARSAFERRKRLYRYRPMRSPLVSYLRTATLEECFTLWEEYVRQARAHLSTLRARAIEVEYEQLLIHPEPEIKRLARFCSLHASDEVIADVATQVRSERAFAYRRDPALREFADRMEHRLAAFGYGSARLREMCDRR